MPAPPPVVLWWIESCAKQPQKIDAVNAEGKRTVDDCEETVGPDGQKVMVISDRCIECSGPSTFRSDAYVTWNNAKVTLAVIRDTKYFQNPSVTVPQLTSQQLAAIALNPNLTVTS